MNTLYEVTAIIPAYNAEKYVEKAITSVLEQTVKCKVIVVDDASTDGTADLVEKYQIQYPEQVKIIRKTKNEGVSAARNDAVKMADTTYVAFLDADDWWSDDKTEIQLQYLKEKKADVCYSGRELISADGTVSQKIVHVPEYTDYDELLKGNVVPCSSVLLKREITLKYPMKHDELHEDYVVWLSMLRDGVLFVGVDKPFLKSRLAEGGKSRNKWKSAMMTYKVYRYMGLPVHKALWCFVNYALNGVKKYY